MVSVKNTSARLIVLFGVNCIPGQVTDLPVENNEEFKATIKGVEGLKVLKSSQVKGKAETKPEDLQPPENNNSGDDDLDEDETKSDNNENSNNENKPAGWNVSI